MKNWSFSGVDWPARQSGPIRKMLRGFERLSLALETPVGRWVRSPQLNPLYHTGPVTVFLLLVIGISGVFLTLFYQFGFQASYQSVAGIESNLVGRVVRAIHRYASDAALIATLLHGWRTFFQDRFRGPRWLAWLTGVGMAGVVWLIGVTGYWLIWDERSQPINQTLVNLLRGSTWGQAFLVNQIILPEDRGGWIFVLLVISQHIGLSLVVGAMLWLHLQRLSRPKWFPPNFWMGIVGGLILAAALFFPVGMLPAWDPQVLPSRLPLDIFYLFHLPAALGSSAGLWWGGLIASLILAGAAPWLLGRLGRRPLAPVRLDENRCTGCTLCAADCPYKALRMVKRRDGKRPQYVAKLDPALCVACGICIGSCSPAALALVGEPRPELRPPTWQEAVSQAAALGQPVRAVFTCERHAMLISTSRDRSPEAGGELALPSEAEVLPVIIPVVCIGMVHPDWVSQALDCGAEQVQLVGCPPEDCANREGSLWMQERLERRRLPRLRLAAASRPVYRDWLPPNHFRQALVAPNRETQPSAYAFVPNRLNARSLLPPVILLAAVLGLQLLLTDVPYTPYPASQGQVEIVLRHHTGFPLRGQAQTTLDPDSLLAVPPAGARLVLFVDGHLVWERTVAPIGSGRQRKAHLYEQVPLAAGEHVVRLELYDPAGAAKPQLLHDGPLTISAGKVVRLAYEDQVVSGDPQAGADLFSDRSLGSTVSCRICHSLLPDTTLVGPSLAGVASRASVRVPGLSAGAYLRQAILEPDAYVVPGFPDGQMVQNLGQILDEQQVADLVAYLMTLK